MRRIFTLIGLLPFCIGKATLAADLTTTIEGGTGHLRGYVQTPKGGTPGTTSYERPSFQELDQHTDSFWQAAFTATYETIVLEGKALFLNPQASDLLSTALITHSRNIPADHVFNMKVHYDWYMLGIGKRFDCLGHGWEFTPAIEVNWLHYQYDFDAPLAQSQRAFTLITVGFSLDVTKQFTDTLTGFASIQAPFPLSNFRYAKASLGVSKLLWQCHGIAFNTYLKTGIIQLDYEDEQMVPNHLRYTNFPYIALGFAVRSQVLSS